MEEQEPEDGIFEFEATAEEPSNTSPLRHAVQGPLFDSNSSAPSLFSFSSSSEEASNSAPQVTVTLFSFLHASKFKRESSCCESNLKDGRKRTQSLM